ncbi:MAG: mechanosensitive ion channel family protein [Gemmatimonadota bacterium]|nr:mechanosensitive ion channel family protein [Gemmatimonadota bacterium]
MQPSLTSISSWYGNSPAALTLALGVWLAVILVLILAQRVLIGSLEKRASKTATEIDNFLVAMLRKTRFAFIVFVAMSLAAATLSLPPRLRSAVAIIGKVALLLQIAIWGGELIVVIFRRYFGRSRDTGSSTTVEALSYVARLILWVLIILVGLESFGIHVTALVAGLGIGGIAVALAVQNILGDVFAALSILFDKPFVVGDLIEVGPYSGMVLHVGIKSTRMRSVTGEQIILANGELLKSGVRNFERLGQRRAVLITRIAPATDAGKAKLVPELIRGVIEGQHDVKVFRSHFKTITDNSFEYETVYYLPATSYERFLDTQQAINLALLEAFKKAGINLLAQKALPPALRAPEAGAGVAREPNN